MKIHTLDSRANQVIQVNIAGSMPGSMSWGLCPGTGAENTT